MHEGNRTRSCLEHCFACSAKQGCVIEKLHLSGDGDFIVLLVSQRRLLLVFVVKCNAHSSFRDSSLTILVDKFLQICCSHLQVAHKYVPPQVDPQQSLFDFSNLNRTRGLVPFSAVLSIHLETITALWLIDRNSCFWTFVTLPETSWISRAESRLHPVCLTCRSHSVRWSRWTVDRIH